MRGTIDKAGRLVIPRALRERVGLVTGGMVELTVEGAGIRVEPLTREGLVEEGRFLVIPASGEAVDDEAVRQLRDADQR